ncbi:MAG TPA: tRNA (adenosine(37)-N6)-threonylcarbamoyltransferase complex ATPase subunit type 1 TsaE [bacterium (Candidatus Stahlbacteria)]|nr:tRNA (adenosine(37)-N6)-threonylcarbamoyltransferase complex ATPase subunit type 1 TsaE [Candidatus Stahlbacteria bacterium]
MKSTCLTRSAEESCRVGEQLGLSLKPGDVVAFYGEIGAGKTTFIKGICQAFSVKEWVKSPSFVLVREYPGQVPIYHIDLYRIAVDDPFPIIDDYLDSQGIVLIEWAGKIDQRLPPGTIKVRLSITGKDERRIEIADPRH